MLECPPEVTHFAIQSVQTPIQIYKNSDLKSKRQARLCSRPSESRLHEARQASYGILKYSGHPEFSKLGLSDLGFSRSFVEDVTMNRAPFDRLRGSDGEAEPPFG